MDKLKLEPQEGTDFNRRDEVGILHVYESGCTRETTGEPLLSLKVPAGRGIRLTVEQTWELYQYLGNWLHGWSLGDDEIGRDEWSAWQKAATWAACAVAGLLLWVLIVLSIDTLLESF